MIDEDMILAEVHHLEGLPKYRDYAFRELIPIAHERLLEVRKYLDRYESDKDQLKFSVITEQGLTEDEAASYVTGDSNLSRARQIFKSFRAALHIDPESGSGGRYRKTDCEHWKADEFPGWKKAQQQQKDA
jgi:hypothetical protein